MAFFKAIGDFINEWGLSYMMIESNIIASGSVDGLVEGKHFNRCKRLHPLMALGLKMLYFDHFLDNIEFNFLKKQVIDDLLHYQEVIDSHSSMPIELPNNVLSRVLSAYQKFVEEKDKFKSSRIDIVFGQHFTSCIKDCERLRRNETTSTVSIGSNQIRHHNFAGELKNTQFMEALVKIVIDHWANDNMYPFIGNKTIYLSFDKCYSYRVISVDAQVVVRCSDSDILIIFLGTLDHLKASMKLWIQWGVRDHERLISINDLYQDLCITLSKALPCFQAITGCDYIPAFFRKASGWIANDDKYDFFWFAGEQFSSSVADIVIKKPTLLEKQNAKQDDDYDDTDNNGSSDHDDDYEDASVFLWHVYGMKIHISCKRILTI
ncbi:uncharacterized protein TNCV_1268041 [Trichonephila clavipes]|nr:uncharacterized protein TNCV_1268041 [Trichonephila clavipes]